MCHDHTIDVVAECVVRVPLSSLLLCLPPPYPLQQQWFLVPSFFSCFSRPVCTSSGCLAFLTRHHSTLQAMPRLAVLVSGCSVCLVASWAFVAIRQQNEAVTPHPQAVGARISLEDEPARIDGQAKRAARLKDSLKPPDEHREALNVVGKKRPAKAKKRSGVKSVSVDRKNIVETVTMDDLRAPPGRLWIPAALSGPINYKDGSDPLFNVLVAYCQLDMKSYHESPWLFAMGPFHQRTSGCLDDPSLTRTYRLSSLKVSMIPHQCICICDTGTQ